MLTLISPAAPSPCRPRPRISISSEPGGRADQCRRRIEDETEAVDPAISENVAERRERQQRDQHRELIGIDDPDRVGRVGVHILGDDRQRDIDDRGVEHRHRQADHQGQHAPVALRDRQPVFGEVRTVLVAGEARMRSDSAAQHRVPPPAPQRSHTGRIRAGEPQFTVERCSWVEKFYSKSAASNPL